MYIHLKGKQCMKLDSLINNKTNKSQKNPNRNVNNFFFEQILKVDKVVRKCVNKL